MDRCVEPLRDPAYFAQVQVALKRQPLFGQTDSTCRQSPFTKRPNRTHCRQPENRTTPSGFKGANTTGLGQIRLNPALQAVLAAGKVAVTRLHLDATFRTKAGGTSTANSSELGRRRTQVALVDHEQVIELARSDSSAQSTRSSGPFADRHPAQSRSEVR